MLRCCRLANPAKVPTRQLRSVWSRTTAHRRTTYRDIHAKSGGSWQGCCGPRTLSAGFSSRAAAALGAVAAAAGGGAWLTNALLESSATTAASESNALREDAVPGPSSDGNSAANTEPASLLQRLACFFQRLKGSGLRIYRVIFVDSVVEVLLTVMRSGELLIYFVPLLLSYPAVWLGPRIADRGGARLGSLWWYRFLRRQMTRAGPTFVKLSQWAASRTDLFSEQMCLELGHLHANNTTHPAEHSKNTVMRAFGATRIDAVFEVFDDDTLGAGAVAQVHHARFAQSFIDQLANSPEIESQGAAQYLRENPDVAIKVLHPSVERAIKRDLRIMHWGAFLLGLLPGVKWLSLPEEVNVFGEMMMSQVDLRVEAQNLEKFAANFAARPGILFPRAIAPLSSKQVLVESYEDGVPLRAFLDVTGHTVYDRDLGSKGLGAFLHMLIYDNFVHADLHPGNILVRLNPPFVGSQLDRFVEDFYEMSPFNRAQRRNEQPVPTASEAHKHILGVLEKSELGEITSKQRTEQLHDYMGFLYSSGYSPELVLLDCGLATSLDSVSRRNFLDLFESVCSFDGERAGRLMVERCLTPELVVDPDIFILRIQDIILKVRKVSLQLSKLTFSDIFGPVMNAVRTHHVKLAPDFINIIMAMFVLEGIGRRLDPDSDILKVALPMLRKWLKEDAKNELTRQNRDGGRSQLTSWHLYRVWLYVEVREYIERIRYWGYDDKPFFGEFSPFITADSSIA
ncbi:ABC1-domain-containing protein [Martensiomyces pterosporus]|nr:ABC1-domain-containing protein [Martensiomyces pterosporus]